MHYALSLTPSPALSAAVAQQISPRLMDFNPGTTASAARWALAHAKAHEWLHGNRDCAGKSPLEELEADCATQFIINAVTHSTGHVG